MNTPLFIGTSSSRSTTSGKVYVTIPTPPTFSATHTLIQATTGNSINSGGTAGATDLLIGSDYPLFQLNGLTGTYRIKSLVETDPSTWATLGSTGQAAGINNATTTPAPEYYNVRCVDGNNLVKMTPSATPQTQTYQNLIVEDAAFAGFLINDSNVGEDYGTLTLNFTRSLRPGGENYYLGNTGNDITTFVDSTIVTHCYGEDSGREGFQANGHADLQASNITCYVGGLDTGAGIGQNQCVQLQNVIGYLKRSIFWNFPGPLMIAADQLLIEDCFFYWTNTTRQIYLQNMTTNGYIKYKVVGGTLTFRRCTFYNPFYTEPELFRLQDPNRNYVFEDCIFPSVCAGTLYVDERGPSIYSITVSGDSYDDSPPLPTFGPPPEAAYVGFERVVTDDHWYNRHVGYRTP